MGKFLRMARRGSVEVAGQVALFGLRLGILRCRLFSREGALLGQARLLRMADREFFCQAAAAVDESLFFTAAPTVSQGLFLRREAPDL